MGAFEVVIAGNSRDVSFVIRLAIDSSASAMAWLRTAFYLGQFRRYQMPLQRVEINRTRSLVSPRTDCRTTIQLLH